MTVVTICTWSILDTAKRPRKTEIKSYKHLFCLIAGNILVLVSLNKISLKGDIDVGDEMFSWRH